MKTNAAAAGVAAVLVLAVTGCLSGGQGDRYRSMQQALARAQAESVSDAPDPFAGESELTRDALLRSVVERNPTLAASRAAWQASLARYPQETALPDPRFGYAARPRSFNSDEVDPGNDFSLSQSFPFPGKLGLRGERALAEADAARSEFDGDRVRLAATASATFDEYWLSERALETVDAQLGLIQDARRVALERYAGGTGAQQDVLGADAEGAMLEHRRIELASARRIAAERINTLLHRDPRSPLPAPSRELVLDTSHDQPEDALVNHALETRPELRAQAALVRARETDVAIARREFLPDFTVRGGYETSWQETPLRPVVGIELNLPLQLERRRAALEEADARLTRERSRQRQLEDQVRLQVVSALERLREAAHLREISNERLIPTARARAVAARAAFVAGRTTFLELIDAERAVRAAEEAELAARAALASRGAELRRALGDDPVLAEETP
jgi:outer membrane protein, heavy metal efflux system